MNRTPSERLDIALCHLTVIDSHLARGGMDDALIFDAVCQRLAAAIEELSGLGHERLTRELGPEWSAMKATRNVIAHNYQHVSEGVILATVERDLPDMAAAIRVLRDSL